MKTIIEEQEIIYRQAGDYKIPDVVLSDRKEYHIGMWANRHRRYLKQNHRIRYYNLLTSEKLYSYLAEIEKQAENMFQRIVKSLAEQENVTEKLKAQNPIEWVQRMNNIHNRVAEVVNKEFDLQIKSAEWRSFSENTGLSSKLCI